MERLLQKQLNNIIDVLIVFFAILALPGVLISTSRFSQIGFRPEMATHAVLTLMVIMLLVLRKKIPYRVKTFIAVASFMLIGYSGLFSLGLSSSGRLDIVISIALACLFYNLRTGIILAVINLILFIAIAYIHVNDLYSYSIDFNTYNSSLKGWVAAFYNFAAMGVAIVLANGLVNQQLRRNLQDIMKRKTQLHREVSHRKEAEEKYRKLSVTDPLTDLYNRRYFLEKAKEEIIRSERYGHSLSIIMMDADHFKRINDTYGHHAGDFVLKEISERFRRTLRPSDIASRFGGEEFCFMFPETGMDEALRAAERLRISISSQPFVMSGEVIEVTCSFGVAERMSHEEDIAVVITRADNALYESKKKGRNKVTSL